MEEPSKVAVDRIFEQLVKDGVVVYGSYEMHEEDVNGYPVRPSSRSERYQHLRRNGHVEFRVCPSLLNKPHTVGASLDARLMSRKWCPGSDLYCPDEWQIISKLGGTHDLALNLFCVDKPQLMLLTRDSYRRQDEPLDKDDFQAALDALRIQALADMYIIYNCTGAAGCRRSHKHMQALRGPPKAFDLFAVQGEKREKIPFQFLVHHFEQGFENSSDSVLLRVYEEMLGKAREGLKMAASQPCPHNVILWANRMMVIPRRRAALGRASANAAGMLGSVSVPDESLVNEWRRLGCRNVLQELGIPRVE